MLTPHFPDAPRHERIEAAFANADHVARSVLDDAAIRAACSRAYEVARMHVPDGEHLGHVHLFLGFAVVLLVKARPSGLDWIALAEDYARRTATR